MCSSSTEKTTFKGKNTKFFLRRTFLLHFEKKPFPLFKEIASFPNPLPILARHHPMILTENSCIHLDTKMIIDACYIFRIAMLSTFTCYCIIRCIFSSGSIQAMYEVWLNETARAKSERIRRETNTPCQMTGNTSKGQCQISC